MRERTSRRKRPRCRAVEQRDEVAPAHSICNPITHGSAWVTFDRVLDEIGKRGAGFKSLRDTWADTTSPHGRLMLTMLGGLAEFERN